MTYSPNSYVPFLAKSKKFVKTRAVSNSFFCESTICFVINLAVSYSTIEHRKWIFDISARLLYKGGYECFEEFFVIKKETFIRVSHLSRDTAKKNHTYNNNAYSNLPNNRVGPFNCVGGRFIRN